MCSWIGIDNWNFLCNSEFFNLIDGQLSCVSGLIWHLDLGGVWSLMFHNVWLINGDIEKVLVPLCDRELLLNVVWLLLILSDWNLLGDDIWDLLDDSVVNSFGNFIGHRDFFFIRNLIIDSVRYFM